jgi:hypothetical protein
MLGFESFASVGGFRRGTTGVGIVLRASEGSLTVAETVSTAFGFSTDAGTMGLGDVDVVAVAFGGVAEAVPEVGGTVVVVGARTVVVGAAGAVVATAVAAGQRWP